MPHDGGHNMGLDHWDPERADEFRYQILAGTFATNGAHAAAPAPSACPLGTYAGHFHRQAGYRGTAHGSTP